MQNAVLVRMVQSGGSSRQEGCRFALQLPTALGRGSLLARLPGHKRFPFNKPHGEKRSSRALSDFVDRNDVRMIQPRGSFRFGSEPLTHLGACSVSTNLLESDDAIQRDLPRPK